MNTKLSSDRMDRTQFERYLAAFNARDYETVLAHYNPEFEIQVAGYVLRPAAAVLSFPWVLSFVRE